MCSNSRWNPTQEQIDMLEGFYKAGIKTPRAQEIQHLTSKLRVYGDIEAKNVFYWFQNHKARQKQRQVRHSYGHDPRIHKKFLYNPMSSRKDSDPCPFPYTNSNGPSTWPPPSYAHRRQNLKLPLPPRSAIIGRSSTNIANPNIQPADNHAHGIEYVNYKEKQALACTSSSISSVETLPLFPIHPTGILKSNNEEKYDSSSSTKFSLCSASSSTYHQEEYDPNEAQSRSSQQFFDFFATH
ncbi:WUSCHEL-related homeobox 5-like [Papaver somniferum]|uniref:WUSCHEL-related homeobox 5-like n=1 Tax=Papaver somniferum TaxID=3469 RepID=UPI000E6F4CE2|nr:WUSCHEL-related homeobox 5-like [Papaver somniferum]